MKYTAVYLPSSESGYDPTKSSFPSFNEAEGYILEHICKGCGEEVGLGYCENEWEEDGVATVDREEITSPLDTSCGAEWFIITDDQYNESEGFEDLLQAAGFERIDGDDEN